MSVVWICGLQQVDGQFMCPYCNFRSGNIEEFATNMCWGCVYSEDSNEIIIQNNIKEETVTNRITDISIGDEVTLTTTFKVSQIDKREGSLYGEGLKGRKFPVSNDDTLWYKNSGRHIFTIDRVKKAAKAVEHMPTQLGDVWADGSGQEYHVVLGSYGSKDIVSLTGVRYTDTNLSKMTGIKLIHRKGNRH